MAITNTKLNSKMDPNWCSGCGNFGIWAAFKHAAQEADWNNSNSVIVAGIGCHGHMVNFTEITGFQGLHGRPIPVASGIKIANHKLNVFVSTGDGDCMSEGGNHLIHAANRNNDITVLLHDNAIYGLTTGQSSPLSGKGFKSKSTPLGKIEDSINPLQVALASGATFIAREYSGNVKELSQLIIKASEHKGFAIIDILQPCVAFNKTNTHTFYRRNIYNLPESYEASDKNAAFAKVLEWGIKKIPVGIIYQENKLTYEQQLPQLNQDILINLPRNQKEINSLITKYS
ncbi:MAG: thiamine pyrophosphate-dependent enzyme [Candidatus Buchananbacteria bacterium]|nr:thiamine pyrophosphate-dependent enzyme [Candidatus Buchananbacteria bacterium]